MAKKPKELKLKDLKHHVKKLEEQMRALLTQSCEVEGGSVSIMELLKDERIMHHDQPELRAMASGLKSLGVHLFHVGGVNSIHNERYREEIMECEFDARKPWLKEKSIKVKQNGTDIRRQHRPAAECKSVKIAKGLQTLQLKATTVVGEIDKVHTKTGENHEIYGVNTQHHLVCGIFNETASAPIILFHVNHDDFGRAISGELKRANDRLRQENEWLQKPKRDSLKLTLGMFLNCPSLKVFHVDDDWTHRIVNTIPPQSNASFYQSLSGFLGDYTKQVQESWNHRDSRCKANVAYKNIEWGYTSFAATSNQYENHDEVSVRSIELVTMEGKEPKIQGELFELPEEQEDKKDKVWGIFNHNEWVMSIHIPSKAWNAMKAAHQQWHQEAKGLKTMEEKMQWIANNKGKPYWKQEAGEKKQWAIQMKDLGWGKEYCEASIVAINPKYEEKIRGMDRANNLMWKLQKVQEPGVVCLGKPMEKRDVTMGVKKR